MQVTDLDAVRRRLVEAGATRRGKVLEVNRFFDNPDRTLLAAEQGLRVRTETSLDDSSHVRSRITFKGPRQRGKFKTREELEAAVSDGDEMAAIFRKLGFEQVLAFEKRRETFDLDGCEVVLDELPYLGTYVEIEGADDAAVDAVREKLGLDAAPLISASYVSMLADHLRERGGQTREAKFS